MIINIEDTKRNIDNPKQVYELLKQYFDSIDLVDRDKEHFFVIHLDTRNKVKMFELVSFGTINASLVHPREVFTRALALRTASIIIAHNHPSEDNEPSDKDIEITKRLKKAGILIGIEILDHLIYTSKGFHSFKEHGEL
jgi:DNA repair protein RadC